VEQVRALTQKDARNEKKKLLPAICFSGKFEKRADTACIEHSGIICLDFDGFDSDQELEDFKFDLMLDKFTLSVFLSPSGDGLKVLVKIPNDIKNHKFYFKGLESTITARSLTLQVRTSAVYAMRAMTLSCTIMLTLSFLLI